ncbi:Monocarboxylate transporter 6 [Armadillidium nasatum]|uniref:Monocarboxylate transporter 6 n=1 Tax=Armadillidium nasatum TaxID=96803 RepID=A0A5N5TJ86_9CRUS|nr:Monocarboxylate transporter 6 [Armadillidium nasatum]
MRARSHSNASLSGLEDHIPDHRGKNHNVKLKGYLRHPCGDDPHHGVNDQVMPQYNGSFDRNYSVDSFDTVSSSMTHSSSTVSFNSMRRESHVSEDIRVVPLPEENKKLEELQIKDRGYAWVVLAAMFCSNILTFGYMKGFGVFFNEIKEEYPAASGLMAGIMMGLLSGFRTIFAPFAGAMAQAFGIRRTLCLGTAIYSIALFSSYFCTNLEQLAVTLGALIGISHCLIESVQVIIVSQYFENKLSFANGIRVGGNPCGLIVFPLLLTQLYVSFGLKLMFILLSGIIMHIFVLTALMRPFKTHFKINALDKATELLQEGSSNEEKGFSYKCKGLFAKNSLNFNDIKKDTQGSSLKCLGNIGNFRGLQKVRKDSLEPLQLSAASLFGSVSTIYDGQGFYHSNQMHSNNSLDKPKGQENPSYIHEEPTLQVSDENEKMEKKCSDSTERSSEDNHIIGHQKLTYDGQNYSPKKKIYNEIVKQNQQLLKLKPKKKFALSCFKNPHYLLFLCMAALIPMGNPLVLYYTTLYAKNDIGLSRTEVNVFLSFQAVFDFCLRFFLGWLNNKNYYKKSNGFVFCLLLSATGSALIHFARGLVPLMLLISLYTFGPASFHVSVNVILTERFGKEVIASTYGFVRMAQGIFSFIHPILIGYLLDSTGSYAVPFTVMGIAIFMCGVFIFISNLLERCSVDKTTVENQNNK